MITSLIRKLYRCKYSTLTERSCLIVSFRAGLRVPRLEVFVQSILPISDEISLFAGHKVHMAEVAPTNAEIRAICERQGVTYVDLYSSFVTPNGKLDLRYSNDGLHLLGEGYKLWGSIIKPLI